MSKCLVALDFDHTIVDLNSDLVARDLLPSFALNDRLESLRSSNGWTDYMQQVFDLLHEHGVDETLLMKTIVDIPPSPGLVEVLQYLRTEEAEVIVISDSNTRFIEDWLKQRDLQVDCVYSNPAKFTAGRLCIEKYHIQDWCSMSSVNLCKGHILEEHVTRRRRDGTEFDFVAYVGDGHNDICPSLRLGPGDVVFARSGMRLEEALTRAADDLRADLVPWEHGETIVHSLQHRLSCKTASCKPPTEI